MYHGKPNWFELSTATGGLAAAQDFYGKVLGWAATDAGIPGFTYLLANRGGDMIAGMMETPAECAGPPAHEVPPHWTIYFDVDDADAACAKITALGGKVMREPADIPGTGRFAVVGDPQGAVFGILQPLPMEPRPDVNAGAWNQHKEGHGNWVELMTTDPVAGFDFYAELFGWTKARAVDMGAMGSYQLFDWQGADIGGMMGLGNAPVPCWLPYFGVNGVTEAIQRVQDAGGSVMHGPTEVPGPAYIAVARDPQGAYFAMVGPKQHAL